MAPELIVVVLALVAAMPVLHVCAMWRAAPSQATSGRALEREQWLRLWAPFLPVLFIVAGLLGWAMHEPALSDESIDVRLGLLAAVPAALIVRAIARAIRSWIGGPGAHAPALTVGFFRPRVVIAPELAVALDTASARAALEHEGAHARHRDPLRICAAQLATDLLWPLPPARVRFREWLHALELARDEEARERGVDGADLAAAVIEAARLQSRVRPLAALVGDGERIRERVARLLAPVPEDAYRPRAWAALALLGATSLLVALGFRYGDAVVRVLPGILI